MTPQQKQFLIGVLNAAKVQEQNKLAPSNVRIKNLQQQIEQEQDNQAASNDNLAALQAHIAELSQAS